MDADRSTWREPELLLLIALVGFTHVARLDTLTLRGEETRRAQVAAEMLSSGDWIVPRQQGTIYLSRPPLGNWLIAITATLRGQLDIVAIRLPTVLAILATTLLVYVYMRDYVGRSSALLAAAAYPTMGQVLQIGRLAETEGVFTLLVSGSLLLWHRGYTRAWPLWLTWSIGYSLAALAGLAKGPQGPIYFAACTWAYLLYRRDWRTLWSRGHLLGWCAFLVCLGSWQVPFLLRTDLASVYGIWTGNALARYQDHTLSQVAGHMLVYPLEILICTLPWSLVFRQYLRRSFYAGASAIQPALTFAVVSLAVTFPSVWLAPGAKGRYFMPLYPLLAVLIGFGLDHCLRAQPGTAPRREWWQLLCGVATFGAVTGVVLLIAPLLPYEWAARLVMSPAIGILILTLSAAVVIASRATNRKDSLVLTQFTSLAFAVLLGCLYVGPMITAKAFVMNDVQAAVGEARQKLPADVQLTSLGIVNHRFRHYFPDEISYTAWPPLADQPSQDFEYFCFGEQPVAAPLDFAWEPVAEICIDRNLSKTPKNIVVIGRRLPAPALASRSDPQELN